MRPNGSLEFRIIADCCRWSFRGHEPSGLRLPNAVDWNRLAQLARFHRVQGLVWNALAKSGLPRAIAEEFSSDARSIAASNLVKARECSALRQTFLQAGLDLVFLKGLTVGALAYRSPLLKLAWDIDVLIDPADLNPAVRLLATRGFEAVAPASAVRVEQWHEREKESVWARPADLLHIELHTRLADNRALIPALSIHSPRQEVEVAPGISLPTLAADELFAYLAVHGASSAWFRLKWISDFAALLNGMKARELERLYGRSQDLGAGRAAGQALLLADRLFGTLEEAPDLRHLVANDRWTRRLTDAAIRLLTRAREPTDAFLGTWPIHWTQLLLQPGAWFKLSEIRRQLGSALKRR